MYSSPGYYYQQHDPIIIAIGTLLQILLPLVYIVVAILLFKGAISFVCGLVSTESEREQQQRHCRERLAGRLAIACLIVGVILSVGGMGEGTLNIELPGGVKIENAGVGVFLLSLMFAILYTLLHLQDSTKNDDKKSHERAETSATAIADTSQLEDTSQSAVSIVQQPAQSVDPRYMKAGLITLVLLPVFGPFALVVGGFLIWKVYNS